MDDAYKIKIDKDSVTLFHGTFAVFSQFDKGKVEGGVHCGPLAQALDRIKGSGYVLKLVFDSTGNNASHGISDLGDWKSPEMYAEYLNSPYEDEDDLLGSKEERDACKTFEDWHNFLSRHGVGSLLYYNSFEAQNESMEHSEYAHFLEDDYYARCQSLCVLNVNALKMVEVFVFEDFEHTETLSVDEYLCRPHWQDRVSQAPGVF